jgi:XisH protein
MAKDLYHEIVRKALENEGWIITHDPYPIKIGSVRMFLDLGAERLIAAEKGNEKIAIEIKSFVGDSTITDFHEAMGQYGNYQVALEDEEPDRILYLAIPNQIYQTFFQEPFIQKVVEKKKVNLIVYEPNSTQLVLWKK